MGCILEPDQPSCLFHFAHFRKFSELGAGQRGRHLLVYLAEFLFQLGDQAGNTLFCQFVRNCQSGHPAILHDFQFEFYPLVFRSHCRTNHHYDVGGLFQHHFLCPAPDSISKGPLLSKKGHSHLVGWKGPICSGTGRRISIHGARKAQRRPSGI
jgi:hypothetical protein